MKEVGKGQISSFNGKNTANVLWLCQISGLDLPKT